jgi:hypothetical protein
VHEWLVGWNDLTKLFLVIEEVLEPLQAGNLIRFTNKYDLCEMKCCVIS